MQISGASYPHKKNISNEDWIKRPGDLTAVGLRQMYVAGRDFRERYINKLPLLE